MRIGSQLTPFAPNHKRYLRVCFVFNKSVYDLYSSAFQITSQPQIGLLIKAGLDLHQRSDVLAIFSRLNKRRNDWGIVRGAVKRLLDRNHLRVRSGLPDKFNNDIETFKWMVDQYVLHPDGSKAVSTHFPNPLGIPRIIWRELQVGPVINDQFRKLGHTQNTVIQNDICILGTNFTGDEFPKMLWCARLHTQPDNTATPALLQQHFELTNEVFCFFLNLNIAVTDDAEKAAAFLLVTGEQIPDEQADHIFKRDEP